RCAMILKRVPTPILVALGLGCGPSTGSEDGSGSISQGESIGDDDVTESLSGCLSPPEEDGDLDGEDDAEVGPCLSECLDTTGGFISASSDGSDSDGSTGSSGTDSSGTDSSGTDSSGTDSSGTGTSDGDSGTSGGTQDASPRARAWREALHRMESVGT